jgi:hypothetical protein
MNRSTFGTRRWFTQRGGCRKQLSGSTAQPRDGAKAEGLERARRRELRSGGRVSQRIRADRHRIRPNSLSNRVELHANRTLLHSNRWGLHANRLLLHGTRALLHGTRALLHANRALLHANRALLHTNRKLLHTKRVLLHGKRKLLHATSVLLHGNRVLLHANRVLLHGNRATCRSNRGAGALTATRTVNSRSQHAYPAAERRVRRLAEVHASASNGGERYETAAAAADGLPAACPGFPGRACGGAGIPR